MLDFGALYKLGEAFSRGAVRAKSAQDEELWSHAGDIALARGELAPPPSLRFRHYEGTRWLDLLGTQRPPLQFMSERILERFESHKLTGWQSHRVELLGKDDKLISGYRLFTVVGRCGAIDNGKSVLVDVDVVGNPKRAKVWRGMYFDEKTWDGSDFFSPGQTALNFTTRKVKEVLRLAKATNVYMIALAEVERVSLI